MVELQMREDRGVVRAEGVGAGEWVYGKGTAHL